jgi:hypothetical protein
MRPREGPRVAVLACSRPPRLEPTPPGAVFCRAWKGTNPMIYVISGFLFVVVLEAGVLFAAARAILRLPPGAAI